MESVCRFCFFTKNCMNLFDEAENYIETIRQHFYFDLSKSDTLPNTICIDCWIQIESFHKFYISVLSVQEQFQMEFLARDIKSENNSDEQLVDNLAGSEDSFKIENVDVEPLIPVNDIQVDEIGAIMETSNQVEFTDVTNFICDICDHQFTRKSYLQRHINYMHIKRKNKKMHQCLICHKKFPYINHVENHMLLVHSNANNDEGQTATNVVIKKISEVEQEQFMQKKFDMSCDKCNFEFDSFKMAQEHYIAKHKIHRGYLKCCKGKLWSEIQVKEHIHWHLNPDMFRCSLCGKDLKNKRNFVSHKESHEAKESAQYTCEICAKVFSRILNLRKHIKKSHPEFDLDTILPRRPNPHRIEEMKEFDDKITYSTPENIVIPDYFDMKCELCDGVTLSDLTHAKDHYFQKHNIVRGYIKCCDLKIKSFSELQEHIQWHSDPEIFRCKLCNKTYKSKVRLSQHLRHHSDIFKCKKCCKNYASAESLTNHSCGAVKAKGRFPCNQCGKIFSTQGILKTHVKEMHDKSCTQICEICAKICKNKSSLQHHLQTKHSFPGKKLKVKAQCGLCGLWFANKHIMKAHVLLHSSQPIKCTQCDKIAPNQSALNSHMKAVHVEAKFKCHLCPKVFKLAPALKDHIATHTGDKQYKCSYCPEAFIWRTNMYNHQKKAHVREWSEDKAKKDAAKAPSL